MNLLNCASSRDTTPLPEPRGEFIDYETGLIIIEQHALTVAVVSDIITFFRARDALLRLRRHSQDIGMLAVSKETHVCPEQIMRLAKHSIVLPNANERTDAVLETARRFARNFEERRIAGITHLQRYIEQEQKALRDIDEDPNDNRFDW